MLLGTTRLPTHSGEDEGNDTKIETMNLRHGAGGRLADVPEMLADVDVWPAGARSLFVRVEPDEVTGRKLLTATDVGQAPRRRRTQVR